MQVLYRNRDGFVKAADVPQTHPILVSAQAWEKTPDFAGLTLDALADLQVGEGDLRSLRSSQNRMYHNLATFVEEVHHRCITEEGMKDQVRSVCSTLDSLSSSLLAATQIKHQWDDLNRTMESSSAHLSKDLLREVFKRTLACHFHLEWYLKGNMGPENPADLADAIWGSGGFPIDESVISTYETAPVALFFLSALENVIQALSDHEVLCQEDTAGFAGGSAPLYRSYVTNVKGDYATTLDKATWHPGMETVPAKSLAGNLRKAVVTPDKGNVYLSWVWAIPDSDPDVAWGCRTYLPGFLQKVNELLPGGRFTCSMLSLPVSASHPAAKGASPTKPVTHLQVCYVWDVTHSTSAAPGNPLTRCQGVVTADTGWSGLRTDGVSSGTYVRQHFSGLSPAYVEKAVNRLVQNLDALRETYKGTSPDYAFNNLKDMDEGLTIALVEMTGKRITEEGGIIQQLIGVPGVSAMDASAYAFSILAVPHLIWAAVCSSFTNLETLDASYLPIAHL